MAEQRVKEGDRVFVPWGLDKVEGTVEAVAKWGERWTAEVLVTLPDSDEPATLLVPLETVELIAEVDQPVEIGSWLDAFHYEEALLRAVVTELEGAEIELGAGRQNLGSTKFRTAADGPDIVVQMQGGRILAIEAKKVNQVDLSVAEQAVLQLKRVFEQMGTDVAQRAAVVVFSEEFAPAVQVVADRVSSELPALRFTTWRGEQDNARLRDTLRSLV
jgi:Holliday junction resolvase